MAEIISVRFKDVGKNYYFDPQGKNFNVQDKVIVETSRGVECGTVSIANREIADEELTSPLKPVLRLATEEDIVNAAYALNDGESIPGTYTLSGVITKIDTAYSEQYGNITVTIVVGDMADKAIMCYRLKGEGAATLAVGDNITVTGKIKNYKNTVEFDSGCTLDAASTPAELVDAAYALADGSAMDAKCTLTGVITTIDTAYNEQYGNITVTIQVGDMAEKTIMCYRLKGEGAADLAVGQTITVYGKIKNYKGTIEFDSGFVLVPTAE